MHTLLEKEDPILKEIAEPVAESEFNSSWLRDLAQRMLNIMKDKNAVGVAAPQIGVSLRVVIFGVGSNPRYPDAEQVPYTVLINPELRPVGDVLEDGWEGCLSVPGMRGLVPRYTRLHYTGFGQFGQPIDRLVSGFHARVVQHECDHLDGILYPMRIQDLTNFGYTDILFPDSDIADD